MADDLKIGIEISSAADNKGFEEAAAASKDLNSSLGATPAASADAAKGIDAATESVEKATVSKKEWRKIIGKITSDFPLLSEALREAMHPAVFAVAGPIIAFEIWKMRIEAATKALGGIEMPDLSAGLAQAAKYGEEWRGIAEAIAKANKEFNSDESVFKRSEDKIGKQLDADKKLNELNKQKALANLGLQKGSMTDEQYEVNKAGIENYYGQKQFGLEQRADQQRADAKSKEIFDASERARQLAAKAEGLEDPETAKAKIEALKTSAEHYREVSKNARDEAFKARDIEEVTTNGSDKDKIKAIPSVAKFVSTYGYDADPSKVAAEQDKAAREAEEQAKGLEKEVRRRQTQLKTNEQVSSDAAEAAGVKQKLDNEAPDYSADMRRTRATNQALNQGQQQVDATKLVGTISQGGADLKGAIDTLHGATASANAEVLAAVQRLIELHKDHARQIGQSVQNSK